MNLKETVDNYIQDQAAANYGLYLIYDDLENKPVVLFTDYDINDSHIMKLGRQQYVVCMELTSSEGREYDLDFMLRSSEWGNPVVNDVKIHRVESQPRYDWDPDLAPE